jgi:hypothetical protein
MAEIEYAFLADAADARPGQKFAVIGGGVTRLGGSTFPLRHPHLALVVGLAVTAAEIGQEQELRFAVVTPAGETMASAQASVVAGGQPAGRDSVLTFALDLWNLAFPVAGEYQVLILVGGEERKRLPLAVEERRPSGRRAARRPSETVTPPFPPPTGKA